MFDAQPEETRWKFVGHLLADLEMLKHAKGVVCTFSSNICALVQYMRVQEPYTLQSLDLSLFYEMMDKWPALNARNQLNTTRKTNF